MIEPATTILPSLWRAAALAPVFGVVTMPLVPKVGSRLPARAINEVGKARAAKDMRNTRSFGEATFFVKFDNNAVDILFGFIIIESIEFESTATFQW